MAYAETALRLLATYDITPQNLGLPAPRKKRKPALRRRSEGRVSSEDIAELLRFTALVRGGVEVSQRNHKKASMVDRALKARYG